MGHDKVDQVQGQREACLGMMMGPSFMAVVLYAPLLGLGLPGHDRVVQRPGFGLKPMGHRHWCSFNRKA